jgi:hypothetical protein
MDRSNQMDSESTFWNEEWKDINLEDIENCDKYKVSNYGRIKSFINDPKNGKILKPSLISGYQVITLRKKDKTRIKKYVHKIVAEAFIEKQTPDHKFVIHNDFNKTNNFHKNLIWATKKEKEDHQLLNPAWVATKGQITNSKLTEAKVKLLKKKINDPNRKTRLKMIARQFGISEMQLYRIKRGENWNKIESN